MPNSFRVAFVLVLFALACAATAGLGNPAWADDAAQGSPFRIIMTESSDGGWYQAFRLNTHTGEVCWHVQNGNDWAWNKANDSEKIPEGDYDLKVRTTGPATNSFDNMIRIERKTGRTWIYFDDSWKPI